MVSEKTMRETYVKAFGKEFDDIARKQPPLPIKLAYNVALCKIKEDELRVGYYPNFLQLCEILSHYIEHDKEVTECAFKIEKLFNYELLPF